MNLKPLFILFLIITGIKLNSQVQDITWQRCIGSDLEFGSDAYCISNFGSGYLVGLKVYEDGTGITNYHGGGDAWYVYLDSLGNIVWERCYGGSLMESPNKIVEADKGNYYLVNISNSEDGDVNCINNGEADIWVVKIDLQGNIIWQDCYGGPDFEYARDAIFTPDGGLLLMGRIFDSGGDISTFYGEYDVWLCKIDSTGNIQWENTIGSLGKDNGLRVILTSGSTYLALCGLNDNGGMTTCEHIGHPSYGLDIWLVELDMDGNVMRQDCYGGSLDDLGYDIIETSDGFVFTAKTESKDGDITGYIGGGSDIWVVKLDKDRNIVWQKCLGGTSRDDPTFLTQTQDKGYIVIGSTFSNNGYVSGNHWLGSPATDVWIVKIDSTAEFEWQHCFGGNALDWLYAHHTVVKKNESNYVLAPISYSRGTGDVECINYGGFFTTGWVFEIKDCSLYAPQTPNQPTGPDTLCYTTDSTSIYSISPAAHAWGYEWKLEPETAGTITGDSLVAIVTWNQQYEGQVSIQSRSYNDCGDSDWSTAKNTFVYNCVGLEEIETAGVNLKVYPNPATESVVFEISALPGSAKAKQSIIIIRDVYGKIIERIPVQGRKMIWEAGEIPPGIYLYQLQVCGANIGGKLMVY